jgi:hypothetical protein
MLSYRSDECFFFGASLCVCLCSLAVPLSHCGDSEEKKRQKRKEKEKALWIYARHWLADRTKPTDPLEKKPVHLIISLFYVRLWARKDFSFFGNSTGALF